MKLAVAKEHREFFQHNGMIEFEELLNSDQLTQVNQLIDEALAHRLGVSLERLYRYSSEQLFLCGRDLWRANDELRKWICQPRLAQIAAELIEKKPVRLGYDQLFPSIHFTQLSKVTPSVYAQFLQQSATLNEVSCLQGIICGLMLCLSKANSELIRGKDKGLDLFSYQPGNGIFFSPEHMFNFENLTQHEGQRFYLIVYTQVHAQYHLQPRDPHLHALKRLGYIFHDRLTDKLNPIIYR